MRKKQFNSDNSDFRFDLENGGTLERYQTGILPDGSYFFENELKVKGSLNPTVITCAAWLLEIFELKSGKVNLLEGDGQISPTTRNFGILYPPFKITRLSFKNTKAKLQGLAGTETLPLKFTSAPMIFEISCMPVSTNIIEILNSGGNFQSIETYPDASLLSIKAKKLIDENYLIYPSIARIAARLGVTHAHLTRQFKNDFGMSPNSYFRQLRVADVPLKLARGEEIISISHNVGYNDLSRFYKQFRQTTQTSPGTCQTMMKSNHQ